MILQDKIKQYKDLMVKVKALSYAMWLIGWDSETEAPRGAMERRSTHVGVLSREIYLLTTSKESIALVDALYNSLNELDPLMQREITLVRRNLLQQTKVPIEEFVAYRTLLAQTQLIWADSKNSDDYQKFEPFLAQIVDYQLKLISYLETDEIKGYDVLLDRFEEDGNRKDYDKFFNALKSELVPFVKEITSLPKIEYPFLKYQYDIDKQKQFAKYLMDVLGFDLNRGLMKESEHPFTSGVDSSDVRWANHFYEDNLLSGIFSTIHELGHAIYEQQSSPDLDDTALGGGASMAMHESQSRFLENIIGRSYDFWLVHFPVLQKYFPKELMDISLNDWYQAINQVENSLIRVEADELTYSLHIMLRYDIENALMEKQINVKDLPKEWNQLMKEYLNIDVPSDKKGVLQDVHWSGGMFGYFPTYALGSAYAAQIYYAMQKDIDIKAVLATGSTEQINQWLKNKIHQFGSSIKTKDLLKQATNEDFNPNYYIDYLKEKYRKIYQR